MVEPSWLDFYKGDLQSIYALMVVPVAFLAYRLVVPPRRALAVAPEATRFVAGLTLLFAFETILDPIATGPLLKIDVLAGTIATSLISFVFVYLGDLRVLWLAVGVARAGRGLAASLSEAAMLALIVPLGAGLGFGLSRWVWPDVDGRLLWILHESGFLVLCVVLSRRWIPGLGIDAARAGFLESIFGYSAAYYSLWLAADLVILIGDLDVGWALRVVPNQLYYAFWVPFVYWSFFSVRPMPAEAPKPAR